MDVSLLVVARPHGEAFWTAASIYCGLGRRFAFSFLRDLVKFIRILELLLLGSSLLKSCIITYSSSPSQIPSLALPTMANIQTHYQSTTDGVTVVDPRFNHEDFVTKEANFQVNSESNSGTSSPRPMKVSKDGQTVLIPQPSNHSEDPLNWPQWKKNLVLISILPGAFFTDGIITYGITAFEFQAMAWHMTLPGVANSIAGAIFMQGPGGLLAVPLCQKFGR